jgi:hypothetical protein
MIINMTTFAGRPEHYVDRTLESLAQSDGRHIAVNLIAGSRDISHIEHYRNVANIVLWDQDAEERSREGKARRNCTVNAIRALKYGDDDFCLCCEDDIVFREDWFGELMLRCAEIDRKDYVLNLGQRGGQTSGRRYVPHPSSYLTGAQGIFYPSKALRHAVAAYLERNIARAANDLLVGEYAKRFAVLYNTVPALVEHIGQVSCFHLPPAPAVQRDPRRNVCGM